MRRLALPAPTKCYIGEIGAVVRTGRIPHARHLFPCGQIDGRETRVAVRPGVHFGNFQAIGALSTDQQQSQ